MSEFPGFEDDDRLEGFVLGPTLGSGRHGWAFLATRVGADGAVETAAVKITKTSEIARRETAALRRFDHPNLARFIGASTGAVAVEHAAGGTLDSILAERTGLMPPEVAELVRSVAGALGYMHRCGWIHGDINPSNIGIRSDGSFVIIDFATARVADDGPLEETTSRFAGPLRHASAAVDVRALAVTAGRALGPPSARHSTAISGELAHLVSGIDRGVTVSLDEVSAVFDGMQSAPLSPPSTSPVTGRGTTAPFGPRPIRSPAVSHDADRHRRSPMVIGVALLVGVSLGLVPLGRPTHSPASPSHHVASTTTADASLLRHGVQWNQESGLLSRIGTNDQRWTIGRAGDIAAVGDWDCDGDETLGIYRPSTAEWFEFPSWESGATSTPPRAIGEGPNLFVDRTFEGCDSPRPAPRSG